MDTHIDLLAQWSSKVQRACGAYQNARFNIHFLCLPSTAYMKGCGRLPFFSCMGGLHAPSRCHNDWVHTADRQTDGRHTVGPHIKPLRWSGHNTTVTQHLGWPRAQLFLVLAHCWFPIKTCLRLTCGVNSCYVPPPLLLLQPVVKDDSEGWQQ